MPKRRVPKSKSGLVQPTISRSKNETTSIKDELVKDANSLQPAEFRESYIGDEALQYSIERDGETQSFNVDFVTSSQLTDDELHECYNLIKSTSRQDYEGSSFGWHPKRKKREMKEDEMRYLLVRSSINATESQVQKQAPIEAFLSFMLTHDSIPSVPVLYVYEIHLQQRLRGLGLGAHLMNIAEGVAEKVGVDKVMLTCFLSNDKARSFYEKRGCATDVSSPEDRQTRDRLVKADYLIMSKVVQKSTKAASLSEELNGT